MGFFARAYRGRTDIDFPKLFKPVLIVSGILVIASVVSLSVRGLNLSIDFEGGAVWEVPSKTLSVADAVGVLQSFGKEGGAKVQEARDADGNRIVRVQAGKADSVEQSQKIADALAEKAGIKSNQIATNTVGPSWGSEITKQAGKSLIIFLIVISLYISWQLEWRMAAGALVGVLHDVVLSVGIYSIFNFEVTPATVISFLTILGFSLYDTIVVYDRIKDNIARYDRSGQYTFTGILRRSLNQVLMRSANTTIVSLLPVASMLLIGGVVYDQPLLKDFSLALLVGLFFGAYSSIFVASPVVVFLKEREEKYARVRRRAIEKGIEVEADHPPVLLGHMPIVPGPAGATASAGSSSSPATTATAVLEPKAAQYQRTHPPRPRKQGKKR